MRKLKINHGLIQQILQVIGISVFMLSIFYKLKAILLMGGTQSISDQLDKENKKAEGGPVTEAYEDSCDEVQEVEPPMADKACAASGS